MCRPFTLNQDHSCHDFFFSSRRRHTRFLPARGLGDVYKRQAELSREKASLKIFKLSDMVPTVERTPGTWGRWRSANADGKYCTGLLYTSDAADDTPCVDLGGRRFIKKKKKLS